MEREVGGGIGMGKTCKLKDVSFQCMKKKNKKKIKNKKKKKIKQQQEGFIFKLISCQAKNLLRSVGGSDVKLVSDRKVSSYSLKL